MEQTDILLIKGLLRKRLRAKGFFTYTDIWLERLATDILKNSQKGGKNG